MAWENAVSVASLLLTEATTVQLPEKDAGGRAPDPG